MRAWLYCRVANGWDSDASDHLALQKTELEHFCTEHDLTIVGTSMTTGSGENELKTLVQNGIEQDSFDVLLTVSTSRLSRDIRTALHVSRELFQCGKGLCLAPVPWDFRPVPAGCVKHTVRAFSACALQDLPPHNGDFSGGLD